MSGITPRVTLGDLDLTDAPYLLEFGADYGAGQNVYEVLESLLRDGEVVSANRTSNREISLTVLIEDSDMQGLAAAEAVLATACAIPQNTLTVDPGDGWGFPSVFVTYKAQMTPQYGDDLEIAGLRRYSIDIQAAPHVRSVDKIVDNADTAPIDGGTVVDNCESAVGWSHYVHSMWESQTPPPAVDPAVFYEGAGSVVLQSGLTPGWNPGTYVEPHWGSQHWDTKTLELETGAGGYLSILVRAEPYWTLSRPAYPRFYGTDYNKVTMTTVAGGKSEHTLLAAEYLPGGWVRYSWPVPSGDVVTKLEFRMFQYAYSEDGGVSGPRPRLWYDALTLAATSSTSKQIAKVLDIQGSAPAPGTLAVEGVTALGQVLLLTMPESAVAEGFAPDTYRWLASGTTTVDATAINGSRVEASAGSYSAGPRFDIPARLLNAGAYTAVARFKASSATSLGLQAVAAIEGVEVGPTSEVETPVGLAGGNWQILPVGTIFLPPTEIQSATTDAVVRLRVKAGGGYIDEIWLCPLAADLTVIDCGEGMVSPAGASSHLWIDAPSPSRPLGAWWRGASDARVNARSATANLIVKGRHVFEPGRMRAFLAVTGTQGPTLTVEYEPHWHTHAAL